MDETRHDSRSTTPNVTVRFGPGVPAGIADTWHKGRRRRSLGRRIGGGFLTLALAVLTGLVVWWLLRGGGPTVKVTGVSVAAPRAVQHCNVTVNVVGTIRTNGGSGDISYRWLRSDGHDSGTFTDTVHKGQHSLRVPLHWTVKGSGALHAVATLQVVSPKTAAGRAAGAFDYSCQ